MRRDVDRARDPRIGWTDDRSRVPLPRPVGPPRLDGGPRRQQLRPRGHGDRDAGGHGRGRRPRRSTPASTSSTRPTSTEREYGLSETLLGESLRGRRDEVVIATKFGHASLPSPLPAWGARGSRRYIRLAVEGSLRRLQTDWIDLYQLHTPDPTTPIDETIAALDELVRAGQGALPRPLEPQRLADRGGGVRRARARARHGSSRRRTSTTCWRAASRPRSSRRSGTSDSVSCPFFPLHNGLLTGKFSRDEQPGRHAHHAAAPSPRRRRAVGRARSLPRLRRARAASRCSRPRSAGSSPSRRSRA